jgi:DNA-binding FadR family transcriptional regulator
MRAWLASGGFSAGDRLPSHDELAASFGVSRSLLREAIAALKAEGLLTSRRGAGVFVARPAAPPFRLSGEDLNQIPGILNLLELRAAVEIEAAGHAAQRRTQAQADAIRAALARIDDEIERGAAAVDADLEFHLAIAAASNNPRFSEFLGYLRTLLIPRQQLRSSSDPVVAHAGYLRMLQREHGEIEQAIRVGDAVEARAAMRRHLVDGAQRYRRWAEQAEAAAAAATGTATGGKT